MTKSRPAFSAFVVLLLGLTARAQDKSADVTVSAPSMPSASPTTPSLPGAGPALSLPEAGINVPTDRTTQAGQGSAAAASPQAAAARLPGAPAAPAQSRSGPELSSAGQQAAPAAVRQQLDATVSETAAGEKGGAAAGAIHESGVFRKMYDEGQPSRKADSISPASSAGAVLGRNETFGDRIDQIAASAKAASDEAAPGFYKQAFDETRQAAKEGRLSTLTTKRFLARLFELAQPQGRRAIPGLAKAAAAAGPVGSAKPLKAIKDWENLFDLFGKPVPKRDAQTQALIAIALDHAKADAVPPAGERAPTPSNASAASPVKAVPPLRLGDVARDADIPELSSSWLDDVFAAHSRNPGADPMLLYQIARRGAGRLAPAAAAAAANQAARTWLAQAWQWLRQLYLRYFGPQAAVDLGSGLVVRGPAAEVSGLAALKRAPTASEVQAARDPKAHALVVAVDLSAVEVPYAAALRLLSSPTPLSAAAADKLLAHGEALALASRRLTGDDSGWRAYERLKDRLAGQAALDRVDARLLGFWLGILRDAALSRVGLAALDSARRNGPVVISDSSSNGLLIVAAGHDRAASLADLGFEVSPPRQGLVLARMSLSGLDVSSRREALGAAVSAAAGHDVSAVAGGQVRRDAVTLLAFVRANPASARNAAAELEAEAPFISRRFEPLGRVSTPQGRFVLERSRRALAGRLEVIEVLRGESGRAAFARKTFTPLPR